MNRYLIIVVLCLFGLTSWGCSDGRMKGLVKAKGTVTLDGEPISGASLLFSPVERTEATQSASAISNAQGQFELTTRDAKDGAFPGEYTVTVTKMVTIGPDGKELPKNVEAPLGSDTKHLLPEKYSNRQSTDMKITIPASGDENILVELKK